MIKLKKTGQMEIIGLVLVVFLLSIGMFFLVSISNKETIDSRALIPQDIDLAQNMIDAIKSIKLDCPMPLNKKIGIDDLVRDIATDNQIFCNETPSKEFTKKAISNILNRTLTNWSKPYAFVIIKNEGRATEAKYLSMSTYNCTMLSEGKPGSQPFPLRGGAGTVTMKLHICS